MGRRLYDYFGYIYNLEYVSLYADQEYGEVCDRLGRMVIPDGWGRRVGKGWSCAGQTCLIQHRHPIYLPGAQRNYDALMRRNEAPALYAQDRATYERRKGRNFDVKPFPVCF